MALCHSVSVSVSVYPLHNLQRNQRTFSSVYPAFSIQECWDEILSSFLGFQDSGCLSVEQNQDQICDRKIIIVLKVNIFTKLEDDYS